MRQYIVRRILTMIPVLLGISLIIFFIFAMAPGDAVTTANPHMSVAARAQIRHQMHLDKPKIVQYLYWLKGALHGDFGTSTFYKKSVGTVINSFIWNSFILGLTSTIAVIAIAVPVGVVAATKQYSKFDSISSVFALLSMSIPDFFIGLLLIKFFSVDLPIFPISGMTTTGSTAAGLSHITDVLYHMFLPFLVLTITSIAGIMKYMRSNMLEVISEDYIRTARAKGLREKVVIYKHALRNALIPIITLLGFTIPGLFAGAIITEQIFSWPGIGPVTYLAVINRDYPLSMGINMIYAVLMLIGNLIADVTYAVVDPRIRLK
ncbi:MAG: ABC transporter permease [Clostridium sp.]|nr:ABC transporter permease [Clostridium sp.]